MTDEIDLRIFDETIKSSIRLERYAAGTRLKVFRLLEEAKREIIKKVIEIDPTQVSLTKWKTARLQNLEKQMSGIIDQQYTKIKKTVDKDLKGLSVYEATAHANIINKVLGVDLCRVRLTQEMLHSIVDNTLIDGQVVKKWFNEQANTLKKKLSRQLVSQIHGSNTLQVGMTQGESVGELVRRIRGTALEPTPFRMAKREAEALVRTSVAQVSSQSRAMMYKANQHLMDGYRIIATLDSRTTPLCMSMDGAEFDMNWNPKGGALALGPPPYHFNCRSSYMPIMKPLSEIVNSDKLNKKQKQALRRIDERMKETGARAAKDGPVPKQTTYNEWLKTQSKETQLDVLGRGRYKLWSEGKITSVQDLVNQNGRPLTLDQLYERYGR